MTGDVPSSQLVNIEQRIVKLRISQMIGSSALGSITLRETEHAHQVTDGGTFEWDVRIVGTRDGVGKVVAASA
jgi:hypothetical protein